ncbi:ATPase [Streptomyces bambusae]|uniref:BadF/BadG/BcrA/BcrD ATPase family protein n=1 Tax=Streptomyces bambusae TaxID=1550616 RepID=UPI001CFDB021|nr:BadF/BadG/BcrA/BcrD ATPase family protein [Streptomyces bambusae]MCB5168253.1 ATPase [Streptomyces bambusae]
MDRSAKGGGSRTDTGVWVAGVDVGGTGVRIALARLGPDGRPRPAARTDLAVATRTGPGGVDAGALLDVLLPALDALLAGGGDRRGPGGVRALALGATGMVALGRDLAARLPGPLAARSGACRLVLASDAVCAYAGALGAGPGVVVAAGTGLVALGTGPAGGWRRADGWGHLLGDCGGGAWIGRAALDAALRWHDGRDGGSAALLARAAGRYGPPEGWPAVFQGPDRAALLAGLAPEVAAAAAADPAAAAVLDRAADEIAGTAAAVAAGAAARRIALTGRLFELPGLRDAVAARLTRRLPDVLLPAPDGDPLLGALRLAAAAARGNLPWPEQPPLLRVLACT